MNLPTCATGQPKRGVPRTSGSLAGLALRMRASADAAELRRADVRHHAAQVAQLAVEVDEAGFFLAGVAIANQFHSCFLRSLVVVST